MNAKLGINMPLKRAFSLIELLTVITIIAILGAVAIPALLNNIISSKINSLWSLAQPAKLYVETQYLKHNTAMADIIVDSGAAEVTTSNSDLVKCVTIQEGIVSVVGDPDSLWGRTFWVAWTPTVTAGEISWACTYNAEAIDYIGTALSNCSTGAALYTDDAGCL
jgi:prepilin-type N-terminal cleavage/methylation domain-containing protein